jgi:hypothetical protein
VRGRDRINIFIFKKEVLMIKVQVGTNTDRKEVLVNPEMTPKQLFKKEDISFATAVVYLDGVTLKHGEMDKSFAQLGVTDTALLTAVVKIQDGAVLKTIGRAVVITSKVKLDDLHKMGKYNPSALVTKRDDKEVFGISSGVLPSLSNNGVTFNDSDAEGFARVTLIVPDSVEDTKEYVKERYTIVITELNNLEAAIEGKLKELNEMFTKAEASMKFE